MKNISTFLISSILLIGLIAKAEVNGSSSLKCNFQSDAANSTVALSSQIDFKKQSGEGSISYLGEVFSFRVKSISTVWVGLGENELGTDIEFIGPVVAGTFRIHHLGLYSDEIHFQISGKRALVSGKASQSCSR